MNTQELINYTRNQVNFLKHYREENSIEGMNYYKDKFKDLALRVMCLNDEEPKVKSIDIKPVTTELINKPIKKDGNPNKIRPWRVERDLKIKDLVKEARFHNVPIDEGLVTRIAQIVGTTKPKVYEVIALSDNEQGK